MAPFFVNTPQVQTRLGKWIFLEEFEAVLPKMKILKIFLSKIFISLEIMPYGLSLATAMPQAFIPGNTSRHYEVKSR